MTDTLRVFLKTGHASNIQETLKKAFDTGYAGLITNIFNNQYIHEFVDTKIKENQSEFTRTPMILHSWYNCYPHLNVPNLSIHGDEDVLSNNRSQFMQELTFAIHIQNDGVISLSLDSDNAEAMGEFFKEYLEIHRNCVAKFIVVVNMTESPYSEDYRDAETDEDGWGIDQWGVWNRFHAATGYSSHFQLNLALTADLPTESEIRRWLGERIGMFTVPISCFITNNKNFPVLSPAHQRVVKLFHVYATCPLAVEVDRDEGNLKNYTDYLKFVCKSASTFPDYLETDTLRYPLQPLHDDLDFATYNTFEQDVAKYKLYQMAIETAMVDMIPESEKITKKLTLLLVGAGRGPLIRAAINATKNTGRCLKIIVVEKNANAICTLKSMIKVMWPDEDITLIMKDMRDLKLEENADILVSELLGSFGDNELSPECLDGAQKHLKPTGISIPCNSVSYVRPVTTWTIHHDMTHRDNYGNKIQRVRSLYSSPREVSWLICFRNVYYIDDPKETFRFVHPNREEPINNLRHTILNFKPKEDCVVHGFAGYFTSELYKDIKISIHPETHTQSMTSWYPIFFPTPEPIVFKKGQDIIFEISRKADEHKVWYEWKTQNGTVQNENGDVHPIYLQ